LEYLGRAFDDEARSTRSAAAVFGLIATMTGGGVLSLPYAMSQCGLVFGTIALILSGIAAAWTVDMLVECARCTGRDTFELVGHAAFGETNRKFTMFLVFILCWLASVGYYVLLGDLIVPLLDLVSPDLQHVDREILRRLTLLGATVLLAPMCFSKSLGSLQWLCFASVGSVVIVAIVIFAKALPDWGKDHNVIVTRDGQLLDVPYGKLDIWPRDAMQAIYAVPTFAVSFMCHFNALPTHQELARPTIFRMRKVNAFSIGLTAMLYLFFGLSGYVYAGECACSNILLNFGSKDPTIVLGRICLSLVIMLNMPLLIQPSRNALFRLLSGFGCITPDTSANEEQSQENAGGVDLTSPSEEQRARTDSGGSGGGDFCMVETEGNLASPRPQGTGMSLQEMASATPDPPVTSDLSKKSLSSGRIASPRERVLSGASRDKSPPPGSASPRSRCSSSSLEAARVHVYLSEDTRRQRDHTRGLAPVDTFLPKEDIVLASAGQPTLLQRCVITAALIACSLSLACLLKNIMVVWSILGSTVCFLVGFILPAAFWVKIVGPSRKPHRQVAAAGLIAVSVFFAIFCTILTIERLETPPCPEHLPAKAVLNAAAAGSLFA
jgi:amino acid permease